ncbi:sigma factor-like helix-turn-helix DNA-binding protein [Paenibacillus campinasensis]|uniref:RNA polymerase subunit sigma n=1 Tax=Paenibacillus campinasensis TaxID=66347 RepID=A0A268EH23_9BACL|nr:sigma factor-like helix-turn-helix DNA-binding protein [Paenibacillus campinasensis]PAD72428.1 RNA polymerase subunit sigma [Paenibacillus campinasensis]
MGAVKVDTEKQARAYEVKYALNDAAGVKALLRDRHRIGERRYKGDTAASDILIDLHSAIYNAGLTDRQAEAIAWVYGRDLTQAKAAEIMGIAQKNVSEAIDRAAEAIAAVFARWEYGEVSVEYADAEEIEEEAV